MDGHQLLNRLNIGNQSRNHGDGTSEVSFAKSRKSASSRRFTVGNLGSLGLTAGSLRGRNKSRIIDDQSDASSIVDVQVVRAQDESELSVYELSKEQRRAIRNYIRKVVGKDIDIPTEMDSEMCFDNESLILLQQSINQSR